MKLPKRASMIEFYYTGLDIDNAEELRQYILNNKWYFEKQTEEIKQQFRDKYKNLKRLEENEKL